MSKAGGRAPKPAWDQRGNDASVWKPLLHGKRSGTFVVRTSKTGGEDVVASITIVKAGGGAFFERRIVSSSGGGFAIFRSEHVHSSIAALVDFYQDPDYFAQDIKLEKLDVPAPLIVPESAADVLYGELDLFWQPAGGGGGSGGAAASSTAAESNYGSIYDDICGGTIEEQKLYERIVDESIYYSIFNPMDEVAITPLTTLTHAVEVLAAKVKEISKDDGRTASMFATAHAHLGKEQRPGGAALNASDIGVLYMYTMPTNFYGKMNATLGGYDGSGTFKELEHYLPVTKLLVTALAKLPRVSGKLFRGVKMSYKDILKTPEGKEAKVGDVVQWNQFISCSPSPEVLRDSNFLGVGTAGTVFHIIAVNGASVKPYSAIEKEDEVVLPPGSRFVIDAITPCKDGVTEVRMRQISVGVNCKLDDDGFCFCGTRHCAACGGEKEHDACVDDECSAFGKKGGGGSGGDGESSGKSIPSRLSLAISRGQVEMVRMLLTAGADPSVPAPDDPTRPPLYIAAQKGHVDVVTALVASNADVNQAQTTTGCSPVWQAAQQGHVDVVTALVASNADVNQAATADGSTPVFVAAQQGHVDAVTVLVASNADVNQATTTIGTTPVYVAAWKGHVDVVNALVASNADVNQATTSGATPVYRAAQQGHFDVVTALVANNADVHQAKTDTGTTPLWQAAWNGHVDVVTALVASSADVNQAKTTTGATPVWMAAQEGHVDVVNALVASNADVNQARTDIGATPVWMAALQGHFDVVTVLVANNADVHQAKTDTGTTPLYIAAEKGHVDVVTALVAGNADVNQARTNGATPVFIAAAKGYVDMVKALVASNADVNQAKTNGSTPMYIATTYRHTAIVALLKQHGAV